MIEAAPEEMHRAYLADKSRAEHPEHLVDLSESAPEPVDHRGVVGRMRAVFLERHRVGNLDRHGPEARRQVERAQPGHDLAIEIGNRARDERNACAPSVADRDAQAMVDAVEIDL